MQRCTNVGFMLVIFWPPVALTNSLLMNRPVFKVIFLPFGAVRLTVRSDILRFLLELNNRLKEAVRINEVCTLLVQTLLQDEKMAVGCESNFMNQNSNAREMRHVNDQAGLDCSFQLQLKLLLAYRIGAQRRRACRAWAQLEACS